MSTITPDRLVKLNRREAELVAILSESDAEHEKLLAYARTVAGTRNVHSVEEVLDEVTKLRAQLARIQEALPVEMAEGLAIKLLLDCSRRTAGVPVPCERCRVQADALRAYSACWEETK